MQGAAITNFSFLSSDNDNYLLAVYSEATEAELIKEASKCLNAGSDILYLVTNNGTDGHNSAIRGARRLVELAEGMMDSITPS